ncbi:hypothetical protein ACFWSG_42580, partial [Streptomyces sp. NPDC058548]
MLELDLHLLAAGTPHSPKRQILHASFAQEVVVVRVSGGLLADESSHAAWPQTVSSGSCMLTGMNTEASNPAELAALREIFASRPEAAPPAGWEAVRSFEGEHGIVLPEP